MVSGTVRLLALSLAVAAALAPAPADAAGGFRWRDVDTASESHFRGLAAVSANVAWVGGYDGTVLRTADGGRTWKDVSPGGDTGELQFRDIEAWDSKHAVALAAGQGSDARIYRTDDGGRTWQRGFQNRKASAFYNCLSFWDRRHGIAVGDPVKGQFRLLVTKDGGRSWDRVPGPAALDGEYGFAASGQCLVTASENDAWFATGGAAARVLHTEDRGRTWSAATTPLAHSETGGANGLVARDRQHLMVVGGDFEATDDGSRAAAYSNDGGASWTAAGALRGYRSSVAVVPDQITLTLVAVGLTGTDVTTDGGLSWRRVDDGSLDTIDCGGGACWGSGDLGRVAVLRAR